MFFANIIKAVILGIIEGITEWLPISSTGHLILADEFIKLDASSQFMSMFNVVIQLGAILAVVVLYFHKLNPFSPSKSTVEKKDTWTLWFKVIVACIPAIIIGLPLDDWLEANFHKFLPVAIVLIVYGIAFIIVEKRNKNKTPRWTSLNDFTYQAAVATEFSFFLGIPVMFGASGLKIVKYLAEGNSFKMEETVVLLVGTFVSFVVSVLAIKFLLSYLKKNDFTAFGWYRIILGIILIGYWFIAM